MFEDENGALFQLEGMLNLMGGISPISDPEITHVSPTTEESTFGGQGAESSLHLIGSNPILEENMGAARSGLLFYFPLC